MRNAHRAAAVIGAAAAATVLAAAPALAAPSSADAQWMVTAHQSNLAEIAAGRSAQQHATTATVKRLGQQWITQHTQLDTSLEAAAAQLGVALPSSPSAAQQQALAGVEAHTGSAYDTAWIPEELMGHEMALAAGQAELQDGSDATVLQLDRTAAPVIEDHASELRAAAAQYGIPTSVPAGTGGQAATSSHALGHGLTAAGLLALVGTAWTALRRRSGAARA